MNLLTLITIGIVIAVLFYGGYFIFNHKKRQTMILKFESYSAVLQYHMDKAYNLIHKDQILTYSLEATTLPEAEYNKASFDFIKLVEKLLGSTLVKEFVFLYGDYDAFAFNLAEYFSSRYDEDEIRKTTMNDMMEDEVEPEESYHDVGRLP